MLCKDRALGNKRVILTGLDESGKTTAFSKICPSAVVNSGPTMGFNRASITYNETLFDICDLGGSLFVRNIWKFYTDDCHGIVFMVDMTNEERLSESSLALHMLLKDCMCRNTTNGEEVPLLILLNKYDGHKVMSIEKVKEIMCVESLQVPSWRLQCSIALLDDGIQDAIGWLFEEIIKLEK